MFVPEGYHILRMMVIDPGSLFCGASIFEIDLFKKRIIRILPDTIKTGRLLIGHERSATFMEDRFVNQEKLFYAINQKAIRYSPHLAVIESPFFYQKMPGAYGSLCATVNTIHSGLLAHNPFLPIFMYSPKEVKKQIGSKLNHVEKGKLDVAACVKMIPEITRLIPAEEIDLLDEHSVDTLAIGYHHLKTEGLIP